MVWIPLLLAAVFSHYGWLKAAHDGRVGVYEGALAMMLTTIPLYLAFAFAFVAATR